MVDITFLGTGSAFSARRRGNLALSIGAGDFRVLVEAGPLIVHQLARVNIQAAEIERLFVSHAHGDHTLGFPMLALNRVKAIVPLHVYAGTATVVSLKTLWEVAYPSFDPDRVPILWHELSEQGLDEIQLADGVTLRTTLVPHPPGVPTLAARWDFSEGPSITFVTDTIPSDATAELAHDSDLLIHEANFSAVLQPGLDRSEYFHSTAQQAGEMARQAGCPRLALVHLSPEIDEHPDALIEEARAGTDLEVLVPEDGESIYLRDS